MDDLSGYGQSSGATSTATTAGASSAAGATRFSRRAVRGALRRNFSYRKIRSLLHSELGARIRNLHQRNRRNELMSPSCSWIGELDRNARGRPVLSEERARELARDAAHGKWYTALYATQWTVGKVGNEDYSGFHILDGRGEPLTFESQLE